MKRSIAVVVTALVLVGLSACEDDNSQPTKVDNQSAETTEETEESDSTSEATEPSAEESDDDSAATYLQVAFGDTAQWEDGTTVTISQPQPYEITNEFILEDHPGQVVTMSVTMHNGSDEPVNAFMPSITGTSGGRTVNSVFDDNHEAPLADIMPGQDLTWDIAFEVEDPADITLSFDRNTFVDDPAYFTNN